MEQKRNDPPLEPNQEGQQNRSGMQGGADENPQEGAEWDNYQTRELSSEGGKKMQESDLLRADEVQQQDSNSGDRVGNG